MNDRDNDRLWTAEEVARFLGIHPQTVYTKARTGEFPSHRIGRTLRFKADEIRALVVRASTEPAA